MPSSSRTPSPRSRGQPSETVRSSATPETLGRRHSSGSSKDSLSKRPASALSRSSVASVGPRSSRTSALSYRSNMSRTPSSVSSASESFNSSSGSRERSYNITKEMLQGTDKEIMYWATKRKNSTVSATSSVFDELTNATKRKNSTVSATSSVFDELANASETRGRSRKNIIAKLEALEEKVTLALYIMSPEAPMQEDGKDFSYKEYAKQVHKDLLNRRRAAENETPQYIGAHEHKIAAQALNASSLVLKLVPKFESDLREVQKALKTVKARKDAANLGEIRALLTKTQKHLKLFDGCQDINETLADYWDPRGASRRL